MSARVEHRGFELIGNAWSDGNNGNSCYRVHAIRKKDNGTMDMFNERICFTEEYVLFNLKNADPLPILEKKVFGRARARIDTGLFTQGETYAEVIMTTTPPPEAKPDQTIERYILVALSYLRKSFPSDFKIESIEIDGLCDLAGITKDQYLYNAQILLEKGFIEEGDADQLSVENGGIYITIAGLTHLKDVIHPNIDEPKTRLVAKPVKKQRDPDDFDYDLVISYASDDSKIVGEAAKALSGQGLRVFYDQFQDTRVALFGENLFDYLHDIYTRRGRYCLIFVSEHYGTKVWTNHERKSAQERALHDEVYILPVRLDDTQLPGLYSTIGYLDLRDPSNLTEVLSTIVAKVKQGKPSLPDPRD